MKTTQYFEEQVLARRPYLQREWCEQAIRHPFYKETQADGRVRHWIFVDTIGKYLRVVTLEDRETVLNAFPDRNFKGPPL
ncbi:hypothetical protein VB780_30420 [Leptolyngbya sp. CCNP1308]|uniref:hypothetical protein n=1 Tax=Leptolyngbya sp. CCNP1308 TaxID=3110255 RepID=UPI002B21A956|nr:hypothetical protein [Leptolyngbya sp. CCNP1308]MEA5452925.1 hypothetical protein [Leptolyngbya sp. CCNP1308]